MGLGYLAAAAIDVIALSDQPIERPRRVALLLDPQARSAGALLRF
jgi:hypothetical protein